MPPVNDPQTPHTGLAGAIWQTLLNPECVRDLVRPTPSPAMFIFSDYGGDARELRVHTYSFVMCGVPADTEFARRVSQARDAHPVFKGEMAYKKVRAKGWQAAMEAFCGATRQLPAQAVTIAIDKHRDLEELYVPHSDVNQRDPEWHQTCSVFKPKVRSQVLRITHLAAMLASAFSLPGQNVFWITDNDNIVADDRLGRAATSLYLRNLHRYSPHELGMVEVSPASRFCELPIVAEILSVADLCAGATAEAMSMEVHSESRLLDNVHQRIEDPTTRAKAILKLLTTGSDLFRHLALRVIHEPPGFVVARTDIQAG